jgi:uncharacterized membrane protein YbhN (UPF0104 family)
MIRSLDEEARPRESTGSRVGRGIGWLTGFLLLAGVVVVATHLAEERALVELLGRAEPGWLVAGLLLQGLTYVSAGAVWERALAHRGLPIRLRALVPLGLAKLFTDQAVPTVGLSGTLLVVRGLAGLGVSRGAAVAAMLTGLVAYYLGYLIAIVASIVVFWRHGELRPVILIPAALIGLLAAGVPFGALILHRRASRLPTGWLERFPGVGDLKTAMGDGHGTTPFHPRVLVEASLCQLAIFVLDALTLSATLRAVGVALDFPLVFASFVMTSVGTSLSWLPGGLGAFEASCVALLHWHGVPVEAALAATLLLRGLTFWLPMIPGFALARRVGASPARGGA